MGEARTCALDGCENEFEINVYVTGWPQAILLGKALWTVAAHTKQSVMHNRWVQ